MEMQERVAGVIAALKAEYPDALCALQYKKDYELMIAVRLSAQCTDARVNLVTPGLFARFPTLDAFADADIADVEECVRSCGFYKHKARDIVLACQMLRDEYGGKVPDKMEDLALAARRPIFCSATSTASPAASSATRTASASAICWGWPPARSRKRWSGSSAQSCRRRSRLTSATASSCTGGPSALRGGQGARRVRLHRIAGRFRENE